MAGIKASSSSSSSAKRPGPSVFSVLRAVLLHNLPTLGSITAFAASVYVFRTWGKALLDS